MKARTTLGLLLAGLALAAPAARADFTVTGSFLYVDRTFGFGGFTGAEPNMPIRLATVQVINDTTGAVLATGATDQNGDLSLFVSGSGTANIVVRCFSRSNSFGNNAVRVSNTSNQQYSVSSNVFPGWNLSTDLDVGTIVAQKLVSGGKQGGPFNMLDMGVAAIEYVKAQGGANPPQQVRVEWPAGATTSSASGNTVNLAEDDGFDDVVILHEIGHVVHNLYSDSDSPGGSHGFSESDQDPRLSFGEGWATFFAGAVRQHAGYSDPGIYVDANGNGGTGLGGVFVRARLENTNPFSNTTGGEADELAVAAALWDLVDTTATPDPSTGTDDDAIDGSILFAGGISGDEMQWTVFDSSIVASAPNLTIRNEFHGFFSPTNFGNYDEVSTIFANLKQRFIVDDAEPNNSEATATPYTPTSAWTPIRTLYFSSNDPPAPGGGDQDFYSFMMTSGSIFECETRYPNGKADAETYCDPFITVRRPNGTVFATDNNSGFGRNAELTGLLADATGLWTVEVDTTHNYRKTGSYQFRAQITFAPSNLAINSVTPSSVDSVVPGGSTLVTLGGVGFLDVTGVSVDGIALSSFPPQFTVVDDQTITFDMPLVSQLGPVDITVDTPGGSASATIDVVAPDPPALDLFTSGGFLLSVTGTTATMGSDPGDLMFLVFSLDLVPSVLPGLFSLDIGNNFTSLFTIFEGTVGGAGYVQVDIPVSSGHPGLEVHFQALAFQGSFPLPESNVQTGTILF